MVRIRGVLVAIIVSLCAVPVIRGALTHQVVSQFLPMYIFNYSLVLTAAVFFVAALPPNVCCPAASRRNEIYYMCCIFMCMCTANATLQGWRLNFFRKPKFKVGYFKYDEPYLTTPFGISTQVWNNGINYIFYVAMIFMIDNGLSYRNVALYWAGATLTGEFVGLIGSFINYQQFQYSELSHLLYICATSWVIFKFLVLRPRYIGARICTTRFGAIDRILILLFGLLSIFSALRGLGALNGRQRLVSYYIGKYEPYISHPTKFGAIWVALTAIYGIPFQLAVMRSLMEPGAEWLINLSILYAGSISQGTFVYLSYSYYPISDKKYKIPSASTAVVMVMNVAMVLAAHILMYRCLREPGYFLKPCLRTLKHPTPSPTASEHTCTYIVNQ